ncbi:conserved uncharacterized protein, DUF2284 [Desulfosarcina variabilis str. Montpellier]|uniref:DUF2284 domain-containing protein n=1 Tax=Desulfosarcina variabilis TaxID=2300 RepID=UPI003AFAC7DD
MNAEPFYQLTQDFFDHAKTIDPSTVPIDDHVRAMCEQNACGYFGRSWTCPPAIDSLDKLRLQLSNYNRLMVVDKVYALESSFDWEGMVAGVKDFQTRILKLKKKIESLAPDLRFLTLGAGACQLCKHCSYPEQQPCKHPEDAIFSVEAYGIDVMKMMAENGMSYNNGQNTVTYVGGIFWQTDS